MKRLIKKEDENLFLQMCDEFYNQESIGVLHPVDNKCFSRTFNELMRSDDYLFGFILQDDKGNSAGYTVLAKKYSTETGSMALWIEDLYLREEYRSKSIAKNFLIEINDFAKKNYGRLRLEVIKSNTIAYELYKSIGLTEIGYESLILDY